MKRSLAFAVCGMLLAAGCTDEAADLGTPPGIHLSTLGREIVVPLDGRSTALTQRRLRKEVAVVAQGDLNAVSARIFATSAGEADGLRRALIGLGIDPARIVEASRAPPRRAHEVLLSRTAGQTTDCAAAITPAYPDDPLPSLMSLAHCTQTNNLAGMLANPADLVAPPPLGPGDGAYLTNGVRSWRANRGTGLPTVDTSSGAESSPGGSPSPVNNSSSGLIAPTSSAAPAPVAPSPPAAASGATTAP